MNDLILIPNMDSTPYEEVLHSENNSDEDVEIDNDELEALNDDNPFFDIDTEEVHNQEVEQTPQKVIIPRKYADFGPGPQKLRWYYRQQEAFDNYEQGKTIISADNKSDNLKS